MEGPRTGLSIITKQVQDQASRTEAAAHLARPMHMCSVRRRCIPVRLHRWLWRKEQHKEASVSSAPSQEDNRNPISTSLVIPAFKRQESTRDHSRPKGKIY